MEAQEQRSGMTRVTFAGWLLNQDRMLTWRPGCWQDGRTGPMRRRLLGRPRTLGACEGLGAIEGGSGDTAIIEDCPLQDWQRLQKAAKAGLFIGLPRNKVGGAEWSAAPTAPRTLHPLAAARLCRYFCEARHHSRTQGPGVRHSATRTGSSEGSVPNGSCPRPQTCTMGLRVLCSSQGAAEITQAMIELPGGAQHRGCLSSPGCGQAGAAYWSISRVSLFLHGGRASP